MKKTVVLALAVLLAAGSSHASFLQAPKPYNIGPEGRTVEDLRDFAKPNQMMNIIPNRPIVATNQDGSRVFYTTDGKMAVTISKDGSTSYSIGGMSKTRDVQGNLTGTTNMIKGTALAEIRNEKGEITGYQQKGLGGKVVKTYDHEQNLTATYNYDVYGKNLVSITNEMTQGKAVYDGNGLHVQDVDYEGNVMAEYYYDSDKKLTSKKTYVMTDTYLGTDGTKAFQMSYYDEHENIKNVIDHNGIVVAEYNYVYDNSGNYVLDNMKDPTTKNITYYKDGKQTITVNAEGAVIRDYMWNGSQLVCTFDRQSQETTWYDIGGKTMYVTYNDELLQKYIYYTGEETADANQQEILDKAYALLGDEFSTRSIEQTEADKVISRNVYHNGQLLGVWNEGSKQLTVLYNEREEFVINLDEEPTAGQVAKLVQDVEYSTGFPMMNKWFTEGITDTVYFEGQIAGIWWDEATGNLTVKNQKDEIVFEASVKLNSAEVEAGDTSGKQVISDGLLNYTVKTGSGDNITTDNAYDIAELNKLLSTMDKENIQALITDDVLSMVVSGAIDLKKPL